jgi:Tol biopolymer transport system component
VTWGADDSELYDASQGTLSEDGRYVVYLSNDSRPVSATLSARNFYRYDRADKTTVLVSQSETGSASNGDCTNRPHVSRSGRYAAFECLASSLVPGDDGSFTQPYLRDIEGNRTWRIGELASGSFTDGFVGLQDISSDGRYVLFYSSGTNLVSGDTNGDYDVFRFDRTDETYERVSLGDTGQELNGGSTWAAMSESGEWVAFASDATNVVAGESDADTDLYLRNLTTGEVTHVTETIDGTASSRVEGGIQVSRNAEVVAFLSGSATLVEGDTNGADDVFFYERAGDRVTRLVAPSEEEVDASVEHLAMSRNGRWLGIATAATNLVAGAPAKRQCYAVDRGTGNAVRVSQSETGEVEDAFCDNPSVDARGLEMGFRSDATNIVTSDTNGASDHFFAPTGR